VILENLFAIKEVLEKYQDGLFGELVDDLILKVKSFGCFFASLDIRQDSSVLRKSHKYLREQLYPKHFATEDFENLSEERKNEALVFAEDDIEIGKDLDPLVIDTYEVIHYIKKMQLAGGELAAHRFIISNCQQASDILQLIELFLASGWKIDDLPIDFVPLFE